MYLIGIDVGTTNTKLGIYRPSGEEIAVFKFSTPFQKKPMGGELDGRTLVRSILETLKLFFEKFPTYKKEDATLSVSSLGETVIPVSKEGETLSPGLIWYDRRTIPVYEDILDKVQKNYFIERLLKNPGYFYSINKILWLKKNFPEIYSKVKWFLPVSSYIIFSFTGDACIDYSHAVRTMVFDLHGKDWDYDLLEKLGISSSLFPPLCESGYFVGKALSVIKEELGVSGNIYISSGGHDHLVAALSIGLFQKNIFFNSSGTTESMFLGIDREDLKSMDIVTFLRNGDLTCHTVPGIYTLIASMGTGGIAFKWFLEKVLNKDFSYISSLKYVENKVFFIPRILEVHEGLPQSAFLGLSLEDNIDTLYSALLESLVFELKERFSVFNDLRVNPIPLIIRVSGGPSKNNIYNKLKSNMFNKRVEVPRNKEATLFGAALLGGIGHGIYRDYREAHNITYKIEEVYEPKMSDYLLEKFEKYKIIKSQYDNLLLRL